MLNLVTWNYAWYLNGVALKVTRVIAIRTKVYLSTRVVVMKAPIVCNIETTMTAEELPRFKSSCIAPATHGCLSAPN